jgi:hypothetical protein
VKRHGPERKIWDATKIQDSKILPERKLRFFVPLKAAKFIYRKGPAFARGYGWQAQSCAKLNLKSGKPFFLQKRLKP